MFVHMKTLPAKTADAIDLIIEFSTLGEYGLEYPADSENANRCEQRRRQIAAGVPTGARTGRRPADRDVPCSSQATDFASALRPPRIRLSFTE